MKNYNELVLVCLVPRVLIVVAVPPDPADWLTQDEKALALRHCGYWVSLLNRPYSDNASTVTVEIPRAQVFSVAALRTLLGFGATP